MCNGRAASQTHKISFLVASCSRTVPNHAPKSFTMLTLSIIAGLSAVGFAASLQSPITEENGCLRNPLTVDARLTCPAPAPKQQPPLLFKADTSELWTSESERYERPRDYKVPPPWKGPEECHSEFCLFYNPEAGDGMSLITTVRNAYITANTQFPTNTGLEPTAFYEAEIPGKGEGLIANRTIRKGEIIMQRAPVLLIQSTPHMDLAPKLREKLYQTAVYQLPERTRRRFLNQMGDTVYDKTEKNSFRMFVNGGKKHSAHLGLFPEVSKFNHDCRPK